MGNNYDHRDSSARVAAGVKTALIVCVVGFIALAANRALVVPSGAAAEASSVHELSAPIDRTSAVLPELRAAPSADARADDGARDDERSDNHPASF